MDYKIEKGSEAQIDVTIPWADAQVEFDKMMVDAVKNVSVKGFRKGAVPQKIAEAKVDKTKLLSEVADKMIRTYYIEIIEKEALRTIGTPRVSVIKLAEGNDIEIRIDTAVIPELELPKDWKKTIKKINAEDKGEIVKITDKDIQEELKQIEEILCCPSYKVAEDDNNFLNSDAAKGKKCTKQILKKTIHHKFDFLMRMSTTKH